MHVMRKQNTNHEVEGSVFSDDDFSGLLIQGANELRQRLPMGDRSFTFMSRAHNLRGRPHFVYSVLDEVEQVAMALQLSEESLGGAPRDKPNDEVGERLLRNAFAVVEREQALHIRRLTEILVDLIDFSQTNSNAYYDHYLLYRELAEHRARQGDFDRYFGCKNLNTQSSIDLAKRSIAEAERGLNLTSCWYLQGAKPKTNGDAKIESFQQRFDKAICLASKAERFVLGFYYGRAYREPSQSIHLNIGGLGSSPSWDALKARRSEIWILAVICLNRCRRLLNVRSRNTVEADLSKAMTQLMKTGMFPAYTRPTIRKGDFVSVFGQLAEVVSARKSKFGYKSFRIRYLSKPPLGHNEDWYPAIFLVKQMDGKKTRNGILSRLTSNGVRPRISPRRVRQAMRQNVLALWEQVQSAARETRKAQAPPQVETQ
jgi:hypothetical protein